MATNSAKQKAASRGIPGMGQSDGAKRRRQRNPVGRIYNGNPGDTFRIGDTVYAVAADGSFRKGAVIGA